MYITQEHTRNNGYGSDKDVTHIDPDELQSFKKEENVSNNVEKYTPRSVLVQEEEKFQRNYL